MKWLAIVLLVGVFIAHDSANWLSEDTRYSPAAVFYMLQGAWGALLSALLLVFVVAAKPSVWRDLSIVALAVSIIEGVQLPLCRLAVDSIANVPRGVNLCDHVTGLPLGAVILCLEIFALAWVIGAWARNGDAS